jgi:uncharacterized membrane protein YfcA
VIGQATLAIVSGGFIGLSLGATGGGGALLAVPLLVYVLGTTARDATAMSLMIVGASALLGVWDYGRAGEVRVKAALVFSGTGVVGAWAGAYAHQAVRQEVLLVLFGMLMLGAAAKMLQWKPPVARMDADESCAYRFPRTCWIKVSGIGLLVGIMTGFFGVGGGFVIVPALVLVLGFPMRLAVGTSLLIIALISIGGLAGHLRFGQFDGWLATLVFLGSAVGVLMGTRLGRAGSPERMTRVFALVTIGIALPLILHNAIRLGAD